MRFKQSPWGRVLSLTERRGPDQVGEERGGELAFPSGRGGRLEGERGPACRTEPSPFGVLRAAVGTVETAAERPRPILEDGRERTRHRESRVGRRGDLRARFLADDEASDDNRKGAQGLLVTSTGAFARYHEKDAAAWERVALLRARVAYSSESPERRAEIEVMLGAIAFDRPFASFGAWTEDQLQPGSTEVRAAHTGGYLAFDTSTVALGVKSVVKPERLSGTIALNPTITSAYTFALIPGTISNVMPASTIALASSAPRPKTNGSPPFSRTTSFPARAFSASSALISS